MYLTFTVSKHRFFRNDKHKRSLCQWIAHPLGGWEIYFVSSSRMITDRFLTEMPFSDVAEIEILYNNERNNAYHYVYDMFTNNDCLMALDPDHNTFENCTVKKCSNYDTSLVFNKTFCCQNNISILHLNICISQHKLTDITYYLEHLTSLSLSWVSMKPLPHTLITIFHSKILL